MPQLLADDVTPEKLGALLASNDERIVICSEEAGSLFAQAAGRYSRKGEADLDLWLKGYDGGQTRVARLTRESVTLARPALTAIVTPQPGVLASFAGHPEFVQRGFVGRWLFALPPSLIGTRMYQNRAIKAGVPEAYASAIRALIDLPVPQHMTTISSATTSKPLSGDSSKMHPYIASARTESRRFVSL